MTVGILRIIESEILQVQAFLNAEYMGEFDPAMGEKISSRNGRALVVVHEGFGLDIFPQKYENNQEYQEYLRRVEAEKQLFYENGDPVVIVVTSLSLARGDVELESKPNTLYYVTQENNGFGVISFTADGKSYGQAMKSGGLSDWVPEGMGPWEELKNAGVHDVVMAGEFRGACLLQVAVGIKDFGIDVQWSDVAVYPIADTPELLESYTTLEPLP